MCTHDIDSKQNEKILLKNFVNNNDDRMAIFARMLVTQVLMLATELSKYYTGRGIKDKLNITLNTEMIQNQMFFRKRLLHKT